MNFGLAMASSTPTSQSTPSPKAEDRSPGGLTVEEIFGFGSGSPRRPVIQKDEPEKCKKLAEDLARFGLQDSMLYKSLTAVPVEDDEEHPLPKRIKFDEEHEWTTFKEEPEPEEDEWTPPDHDAEDQFSGGQTIAEIFGFKSSPRKPIIQKDEPEKCKKLAESLARFGLQNSMLYKSLTAVPVEDDEEDPLIVPCDVVKDEN